MKKISNTQLAAKKIVEKYKNLSKKKTYIPFNTSDIADAETVDYNNNANITDLNDIVSNKNTRAQIAAKKCQKIQKFSKEKTIPKTSQKTEDNVVFFKKVLVHPRNRLAKKTKDDVKFVRQVPLHPRERLK